ncbi:hypothetical protein ACOMHN_030500 [Nucella lapillus]
MRGVQCRCHVTTPQLTVMASLRQYVSLVIVVVIFTTTFLLTFLSPGGPSPLPFLSPPQQTGPWAGYPQARSPQTPAVLAASSDGCGGGKVCADYTDEELGLADAVSPIITRKHGKSRPIPDLKSKISALLKSPNSCQRSRNREGGLTCLPYYYLAGFPKCGSTDLYLRLTSHPHIARGRGRRKELHWVSRGRFNFPQGRTEAVESYKALMGRILMESVSVQDLHKAIVGDHSVDTVWDNSGWRHLPANTNCSVPRVLTADVVRHLNPRAKVMVIVRNPTERLYSAHLFFSPNSTRDEFHLQALKAVKAAKHCFQRHGVRACVYHHLANLTSRVDVGLYHVHLADWLRRFPRDQLHVIRLEDMAAKGEEVLQKAFEFLGVDLPDPSWTEAVAHQPIVRAGRRRRQQGPMLVETRRVLDQFYRPFNTRVARLMHDRKYLWRDSGV